MAACVSACAGIWFAGAAPLDAAPLGAAALDAPPAAVAEAPPATVNAEITDSQVRCAAHALRWARRAGACGLQRCALSTRQGLMRQRPPFFLFCFQLFDEGWALVDDNFLGARAPFDRGAWAFERESAHATPLRSRAAAHARLASALSSLKDPYTRFVAPEDFPALTRYDVSGVGVNLGDDAASSSGLRVLGVVLDSEAAKAGIRQGDALLSIAGAPAKGLSPFQAATALHALPPGTVSDVTVQGEAPGAQPRTLQLRGPPAPPPSAVKSHLKEKVGVIEVHEMNGLSARDVAEAVRELRLRGATGFVLDLRDCPGGLVAAGVEIARLFLPDAQTVVAYTEGRVQAAGGLAAADRDAAARAAAGATAGATAGIVASDDTPVARKPIPSGTGDVAPDASPLAVLVNARTASAAEIVAAALRDNCRAPLIGARTYGKGLIQSVYELSDGSGVVMTVGRYVRPSGEEIDQRGIAPDFATFPGLEQAQGALDSCRRPPPAAGPP